MKLIDTPRTGKLGPVVFYLSKYGPCARSLVVPRDPKSATQTRMRQSFGTASQGYGLKLTDPQRQRWDQTAQTVPTHPSLNQYSRMSAQQLCVKINSTLRCVGQPPVDEPPAPVVFSPNPVGTLTIDYDEAGSVRLLLAVGAAAEDIMLFGQPPCSAGRMKHRRVYYLGLAGTATNGQCDITAAYTARFGQPAPGQKVFIVTCQTRNGWKAQDHVTSAIVPPVLPLADKPAAQDTKSEPAAAAENQPSQTAPAESNSSLSRAMYKGSTPDAPGVYTGHSLVHSVSIPGTPLVHSLRLALGRLVRLAGGVIRAGHAFRASPAPAGC